MGLSVSLKYVLTTITLFVLWCTVQLWTAHLPQRPEVHNRFFTSREAAIDDFTHQWLEERGYNDTNDKENATEHTEEGRHKTLHGHHFVVFNVLPKSGSRTLYSLAMNVAPRHGVDVQNTMALTNETKEEKIERLLEGNLPTFVYSHLPFVDFNNRTGKKVVYVSIVRDPIERLVSLYYYKRYGDSTEPRYFLEKMNRLNLSRDTFEECVKRNGDCINSNLMQKTISHFCGVDSERNVATDNVMCLSEAKRNLRTKYLVVGVMEDYLGFVKVLERLLPDMFRGAETFYNEFITKTYFKVMKTKNKTGPSEKIVRELRKRMAKEYEFYDHVKKEFEILKNKLGID